MKLFKREKEYNWLDFDRNMTKNFNHYEFDDIFINKLNFDLYESNEYPDWDDIKEMAFSIDINFDDEYNRNIFKVIREAFLNDPYENYKKIISSKNYYYSKILILDKRHLDPPENKNILEIRIRFAIKNKKKNEKENDKRGNGILEHRTR